MYLKSLLIKNYRKYGKDFQTINFAHTKWLEITDTEDDESKINKTEEYISKNSSLIVGKNNSGKSTIIKLLNTLQNIKAGSRNVFKYTDFNLNILVSWYQDNILNKSEEEIRSIDKSEFPKLEFQLIFGIDDENDVISSFADVLILSGINTVNTKETQVAQEVAEVIINIKYEVADVQSFLDVRVSYICDKKENQCYTEVAQKSEKRFSYEIYYNRRNQIKTACSRICDKI